MAKRSRPTLRRRLLGRELRRLREETGLSQEEAARALNYTDSTISRVEQGQLPNYHALRAMLDVYGLTVDQWQPYLDMYERARERGWWQAYGVDDRGFIALEHEACAVWEYQPGYVPGLLQTADYIREIFALSRIKHPRRWIDNQVAVRLKRQERLTADPPLRFHAVVDEPVLHRVVGGRALWRAQLRRIVQLSELPNVTVRVLSRFVVAPDGWNGMFIVLSFPDADDPDMAYAEHSSGSVHIERKDEVTGCRLTFDHLASLALAPTESIALIERVAAEL
ncbi:helix-turn-helix domain-containing protein [Gandjariella thermophila]|uniref:Transcriptional regulator n=1 Tax=Gandjariella thermophila TaxID=1931992 RepID=A0A4D4J6N2_9PSEU|nr:helix-turn-helix transcriptional regulator [Gandjariella thermophila]GDY31144.1 transcriptional regulator [Gandjariella thermophila]